MNKKPNTSARRERPYPLLLCATMFLGGVAWAQQLPAQKPEAGGRPDGAPAPTISTTKAENGEDETIVLSPFEVSTSGDKGYYSANTMSGTRLNSKIEDLASSITVINKGQMSDFAMLDINDVFLYTANTEGTGTYTALTIDRNGSVTDGVQSSPNTANRIRGNTSANVSFGNIETMGRVSIDTLLTESVEISRGPNANVFGLGNPSGTVNYVPVSANLSRNRTQIVVRGDDVGGYRTSLDVNQVLLRNKLAVRVSGSFQHDAFRRKPSGVDNERYNAMFRYKPFKKTTITGLISHYHAYGNRPNYVPPRDNISYWLANGMPTWDPVAQVVHVGGKTLGPFTGTTGLPDYFTNSFTGSTHSFAYVDENGLGKWQAPSATVNTTALFSATNLATQTTGAGTARLMATTPAAGVSLGRYSNQPLFATTPTVNDRNIYDYESLNIASVNRQMDRMVTSYLQLEQVFLDSQVHTLVGQATWMREDSNQYRRNIIGTANDNGQSGQLFIDVNEKNLDGTPNPYFLRPYIGSDQPRTTWEPAKWDTYRAQLAYQLNLTNQNNWLKWLGSHSLTAYDEYKYRLNRRYSYRDAMSGAADFIPAGVPRGNQSSLPTAGYASSVAAPQLTRNYWRYYVGDNAGANIDFAPMDFKYGTYNYTYGGSAGFRTVPVELGQVAVTDAAGGSSNSKTILKTYGGGVQSHILKDSFVTTFGLRNDKQYVMNGATIGLKSDGISYTDNIDNWSNTSWRYISGKTKTAQFVLRPFRELPFLKRAEEGNGFGSFFAEMFRSLNLTLDKSDSFLPAAPAYNLFLEPLPNPTATGKNYGFSVTMLKGKLNLRVNRYNDIAINSRQGDASTIAQRTLRHDVAASATFLLQTVATSWALAEKPDADSQWIHNYVADKMQLPWDTQQKLLDAYNAGQIASTNDIVQRGYEIELNYNPTRYLTVAASMAKTEALNTNVSDDVSRWLAQRLPVWQSVVDPTTNKLWWNSSYDSGKTTPSSNYASFIDAPFKLVRANQGKSNGQVRPYSYKASASYQLAGLTSHKILKNFTVGSSFRWADRSVIGYYGVQSLPAVITDLDPNHPIYDKSRWGLDAFIRYKTKLYGKFNTEFQLNVRDIQQNYELQPISAYPDGTPTAYRIMDPRTFIFQVKFEL